MDWHPLIEAASRYVVKISTPTGYGTGFLAFYNHDASWCGIATAAHVVAHADDWQQPIRVTVEGSGSTIFLEAKNRFIFLDRPRDSAVVFFLKGELQLPQVPIPLLPVGSHCRVGSDVGWLGYPGIEPNSLCFFSGSISARKDSSKAYLVDGVAINGVSGGPVFHGTGPGDMKIIGSISAYYPNTLTGQVLPGVLRAQDISHYQEVADTIKNWDEAEAKKLEFEEEQRKRAEVKDEPPQTPIVPDQMDRQTG